MRKILSYLLVWITIPHCIFFLLSKDRNIISIDVRRWSICANTPYKQTFNSGTMAGGGKSVIIDLLALTYLLLNMPEFRNVFYLRVGKWKYILYYLRPLSTLYICTKSKDFGAGTYIQHGFATVITAKHIGRNCWINQQVTIGYNDSKKYGFGQPWIGDNVRVSAGAKVCGNIKVGDGSVIGVNAVVIKDIPANSTIVPSPMRLIRENNIKVNKQL